MRIEVKHYNNTFVNDSPHFPTIKDFGESNTDLSTWRPEISVARAQAAVSGGKKLLYDFPDGVDTGERIQTYIRSPGLDITEVETAQQRITQIIEDKKTSDKDKAIKTKESKEIKDMIKKISDNSGSSDSDVSPAPVSTK